MDHLGVIILVGLFALGKWLVQNVGKTAESQEDSAPGTPPVTPTPIRSGQPLPANESEEERMRRFMEALGLPAGSAQPPKPVLRESQKPLTRPPLTAASDEVVQPPRAQVPMPRERRMRESRPDRRQIAPPSAPIEAQTAIPKIASMGDSAPQMEVSSIPAMTFATPESYIRKATPTQARGAKTMVEPAPASGITLSELLHDKSALRKALIMREILGAPKSLQSAKSPSIFSSL